MLDNAYESTTKKNKEYLVEIENLEKSKNDVAKKFKNFEFEHNNHNDLIIKLLKTKINTIRSEINSTKLYYNNEINNIKKEHIKMIEGLYSKIKIFSVGFEKDKNSVVKSTKDSMEKEHKNKLSEKEIEMQNEINRITQKYENNLLEQIKLNEKKEKDNKNYVNFIFSFYKFLENYS